MDIKRMGVWCLLFFLSVASANYPLFDESTKMSLLLLPVDTRVGSVIYRLRATDSDYDFPLAFEVQGRVGKNQVRIETLPCSRNQSACEANVILIRALELHREYKFWLSVRDERGDSTNVEAKIRATNGSSVAALDTAFPRYTTLVMVPENAKAGTELEYIMVRKSDQHSRHAHLELTGSPLFSMKQRLAGPDTSNGTILLNGELDFEKQNLYPMLLYATDPYVSARVDTRNILGFELAIVVTDVQDTPPVFIIAPPVTPLSLRVQPGDVVLRVQAEDGDRGRPRDIRYGLLAEQNPFTQFFNIDASSGEVHLTRSLSDLRAISRPGQPVMLRVLAEEVVTSGEGGQEPLSSVAELALLLPGSANTAPYFEAESYVGSIAEGSPPGTPLMFSDPWMPRVRDNDMGLGAVFSLSLRDDNGTFEVSPAVAEGSANFVITVKNNHMLDYERFHTLTFKVVASEVSQAGAAPLTGSASITVLVTDTNDNPPKFQQDVYTAQLHENVTAGTLVAQVHADDVDTGSKGQIRYTRLLGQLNGSLALDPETGRITVATNNHGLDREQAQEYRVYVEARDDSGEGQITTVPLLITIVDVNDHAPIFEHQEYELYLGPENKNFSTRVFLKAVDADAEPPNNEIRYEIMSGNVGDKFMLNEITGELTVRPKREPRIGKREIGDDRKEPSQYLLNVRAYDLGVPHRWTRAEVRVHSAITDIPTAGSVVFIVPYSPAAVLSDPRRTERLLAQLTGGKVAIREVRPYRAGDQEILVANLASQARDAEKSVVVALVSYTGEPVIVDVVQMQQSLLANQSTPAIIEREVIKEYRADSSALFWFLVFLALMLAIAILALVICFFHSGCPLYFSRKERRTPPEEVRLVLERAPPRDESDKLIIRREAWSADGGTRRYLQFNRRNILTLDPRPPIEDGRSLAHGDAHSLPPGHGGREIQHEVLSRSHQGPSIIYTRELQRNRKHRDNVFLEDIESEYHSSAVRGKQHTTRDSTRSLPTMLPLHPNVVCIKDKDGNRIFVHQEESNDEIDSMRRHEMERGSDLGHVIIRSSAQNGPEVVEVLTLDEEEANGREQHYVKTGNAEVLRLLTRGKPTDEMSAYRQSSKRNGRVSQTDAGKDIIMRRFMEDQRQHSQVTIDNNNLPGQLQTGTQTDEDRGTQTENESINSPIINDTQQQQHAKHVIKTPILEENDESSYENQLKAGPSAKLNKEKSNSLINLEKFQNVVEEAYEKDGRGEFNYGDTKSSMLRRKLNFEKTAGTGSSSEEKKHKSRSEISANHAHRSQSLPRNASETKRQSALSQRQKSISINSGLDKASRVTFASPDNSYSDDETFPSVKKKSNLKVNGSNTSLNKPSPKRNRKHSISDDEKVTVLKKSSSSLSLNKIKSTRSRTNSVRDESISDDENTTKINKLKKGSSLRASTTSLRSNSSVRKIQDAAYSDQEEGSNIKKSNSLRITKAASKRVSPVPKSNKFRGEGSFSDEEIEKKNKPTRSISRNSISPAVKSRNKSRPHESDDELEKNIKKKNESKSKINSSISRKKRNDNDSDEEISQNKKSTTRKIISKTSSKRQEISDDRKNNLKISKDSKSKIKSSPNRKSRNLKPKKHESDSESESEDKVMPKTIKKPKSPHYEDKVNKLNDDSDENDDVVTVVQVPTTNKIKTQILQNDITTTTTSTNEMITVEQLNLENSTRVPESTERLETAMQTDVTLVPLINSMQGRGMTEDDLDSGIAMSQTTTDGRSRRLNQLIEKKSIFTIAYDDMQTKQIRADSASPQY